MQALKMKSLMEKYVVVIKKQINVLHGLIKRNKGTSILLITILSCFFTNDTNTYALWGSVVFLLCLFERLIDHKIKKDNLDQIDLNFFSNNMAVIDHDILDLYINDCFNRYMVIFRGYKQNEYIQEKDQSLMLKELLDIIATNMSPLLRKKLELYYGNGNVDKIMAEKCFIKITLFVANNNKNVYSDGSDTTTLIRNIF